MDDQDQESHAETVEREAALREWLVARQNKPKATNIELRERHGEIKSNWYEWSCTARMKTLFLASFVALALCGLAVTVTSKSMRLSLPVMRA